MLIKQQRGLGFEDVVLAFETNKALDIIAHHNPEKYPNQNYSLLS